MGRRVVRRRRRCTARRRRRRERTCAGDDSGLGRDGGDRLDGGAVSEGERAPSHAPQDGDARSSGRLSVRAPAYARAQPSYSNPILSSTWYSTISPSSIRAVDFTTSIVRMLRTVFEAVATAWRAASRPRLGARPHHLADDDHAHGQSSFGFDPASIWQPGIETRRRCPTARPVVRAYAVTIASALTLSKQESSRPGDRCAAGTGPSAWPPQLLQIAAWYSRGRPGRRSSRRLAAARQVGQRWGSFVSPLLAKNCLLARREHERLAAVTASQRTDPGTPLDPPMCGAGGAPVRRRDRHRRRRRGRRAGQDVRLGTLARRIRAPSSTPTRSNPLPEGCRARIRIGVRRGNRSAGASVGHPCRRACRSPPPSSSPPSRSAPVPRPDRRRRHRRPRPQSTGRRPRRRPSSTGIAHPTGASDIVLRLDECGRVRARPSSWRRTCRSSRSTATGPSCSCRRARCCPSGTTA